MRLTLIGQDVPVGHNLSIHPTFAIKTLLDKMPGSISIRAGDLNDSISSKYYTPTEFITSKVKKNNFSIFHLNIASLQYHIDDLRTILKILDHPFDIICITETKIKDSDSTANIDLDGYEPKFTPTNSFFGGTAIYIKNNVGYDPKLKTEYTKSIYGVAESTFVEIKHHKRPILIGCIYRHHSNVSNFTENFISPILDDIRDNEKNKTCFLIGDFNIDLLKIEQNNSYCDFYDLLSSHGFTPLILQPSRVTATSATLIDNIFVNKLDISSTGGNITSSISDHFPQFTSFDFSNNSELKANRFGRTFKNINWDEFEKDLQNVDWANSFQNKNSDESTKFFYNTLCKLLDEMAPVKKLTKKEMNLQMRPWINQDILANIHERDKLYHAVTNARDPTRKSTLFSEFKKKRNEILTATRKSREEYYAQFFQENKNNIKKHGKA